LPTLWIAAGPACMMQDRPILPKEPMLRGIHIAPLKYSTRPGRRPFVYCPDTFPPDRATCLTRTVLYGFTAGPQTDIASPTNQALGSTNLTLIKPAHVPFVDLNGRGASLGLDTALAPVAETPDQRRLFPQT